MKIAAFLLAVITLATNVEAQNFSVEIAVNKYKCFDVGQPNKGMLRLTASRKIFKNLEVFVSYSTAPLEGWAFTIENDFMDPTSIGKIQNRNQYRFLDLGLNYTVYSKMGHNVSVKGGASVCGGKTQYMTKLVLSDPWPNGTRDIIHQEFTTKTETYWGGIGGLAYDYKFWKNRLKVGADITARWYSCFPFTISYGIHAGVGFL